MGDTQKTVPGLVFGLIFGAIGATLRAAAVRPMHNGDQGSTGTIHATIVLLYSVLVNRASGLLEIRPGARFWTGFVAQKGTASGGALLGHISGPDPLCRDPKPVQNLALGRISDSSGSSIHQHGILGVT
jgi:hypothetical protein